MTGDIPKGFGPVASHLMRHGTINIKPEPEEPEPKSTLAFAAIAFIVISVVFTAMITLWRVEPEASEAPRTIDDPYISVNGGPWVPLSGGIRIKPKAELTEEELNATQ